MIIKEIISKLKLIEVGLLGLFILLIGAVVAFIALLISFIDSSYYSTPIILFSFACICIGTIIVVIKTCMQDKVEQQFYEDLDLLIDFHRQRLLKEKIQQMELEALLLEMERVFKNDDD